MHQSRVSWTRWNSVSRQLLQIMIGMPSQGQQLGEMSQRIEPQDEFQISLRLSWESSAIDTGCQHRDDRAAENFMRQLVARVGAIPHDAQLPQFYPSTTVVAIERPSAVVSSRR